MCQVHTRPTPAPAPALACMQTLPRALSCHTRLAARASPHARIATAVEDTVGPLPQGLRDVSLTLTRTLPKGCATSP